ncbi:uncharacterized protein LOC134239847 [Saccostrea cucullata]|uniref:uncharacterized protein LOC134239847 n=1 Tax=Saccostrea cuccullata TaxID=36930 RepID=UPI002ED14F51
MTVITNPELNVTLGSNAPIVLNCTYPTDISVRTIKWKKLFHDGYKDLVVFDPGNRDAFFARDGVYLSNRSYLIYPYNGSTSAVLIINDVMCEDEGLYQCLVDYKDGGIIKQTRNETTVFLQVGAEKPTSFKLYKNGNLKENDKMFLSCSANVGNPGGFVAIWKLNKLSNQLVILNKSSEVHEKTENCTAIANFNITYRVSRDDHGGIFRCTSQNRQTQEPVPHKDTTAIDVQYGPSNITIHSSSPDLDLYVGENLNLTCSSDGNPAPHFKWKFNSSDILNNKRFILTRDNKTLHFLNLNLDNNGIYFCVVSNLIDGEIKKVSSHLTLKVRQREGVRTHLLSCAENPCGITESCTESSGRSVCTVNIWSLISFLFVCLTMVFAVSTAILTIKQKRDLGSGNILKFRCHHLKESHTGLAQYEVLNAAERTTTTGTSGTENTRYEALNSREQTSILRERNTMNTEYDTLKRETSV